MRRERHGVKLVRGRRGAAMVEFALILPLLIMLVFGMIDFGLLLKDHLALNQTAREAARIYAVGGTPNITTLADNFGLVGADVTANVTAPTAQGAQVIVELIYEHDMIILGSITGDPKVITSEVVMRRE